MNKQEIIKSFDPNGVSIHKNIFGLPFNFEQSNVVVFPIPWDVTSSYSAGSSNGPQAILEASYQVDLYDSFVKNAWTMGIHFLPISKKWQKKNDAYRKTAEKYISALENQSEHLFENALERINNQCLLLTNWVKEESKKLIKEGKKIVLLGGDHSTPLGYIQALAEEKNNFSVLQIDAHADLRPAFENFKYSHASIMYNVLETCQNVKLTQVGVRDYCEQENELINKSNRIHTFFDKALKQESFQGKTWENQVSEIIKTLDNQVYISFDIDGLDPKLCPNTGTPVAGGFETEQILYLFEKVVESGRTIIGMDLNEIAPGNNEWDANVGARLLYKMCNILGKSNNLI